VQSRAFLNGRSPWEAYEKMIRPELIVIVDEHDNEIGESEKNKCHDGGGILHRGFLAMAFNNEGELLLARRSGNKRLWPGYWDGSVASHVHKGEDYVQATRRRLKQELGAASDKIEYAFKFRYRAGYLDIGTEYEICGVTMVRGIHAGSVSPAGDEISEMRMVDLKVLIEEIRACAEQYTPWLVRALAHISERPISEVEAAGRKIPC
jgi:isopentenyl-diphosphate delta-isomerase